VPPLQKYSSKVVQWNKRKRLTLRRGKSKVGSKVRERYAKQLVLGAENQPWIIGKGFDNILRTQT
jgi:hypothetical protein